MLHVHRSKCGKSLTGSTQLAQLVLSIMTETHETKRPGPALGHTPLPSASQAAVEATGTTPTAAATATPPAGPSPAATTALSGAASSSASHLLQAAPAQPMASPPVTPRSSAAVLGTPSPAVPLAATQQLSPTPYLLRGERTGIAAQLSTVPQPASTHYAVAVPALAARPPPIPQHTIGTTAAQPSAAAALPEPTPAAHDGQVQFIPSFDTCGNQHLPGAAYAAAAVGAYPVAASGVYPAAGTAAYPTMGGNTAYYDSAAFGNSSATTREAHYPVAGTGVFTSHASDPVPEPFSSVFTGQQQQLQQHQHQHHPASLKPKAPSKRGFKPHKTLGLAPQAVDKLQDLAEGVSVPGAGVPGAGVPAALSDDSWVVWGRRRLLSASGSLRSSSSVATPSDKTCT